MGGPGSGRTNKSKLGDPLTKKEEIIFTEFVDFVHANNEYPTCTDIAELRAVTKQLVFYFFQRLCTKGYLVQEYKNGPYRLPPDVEQDLMELAS